MVGESSIAALKALNVETLLRLKEVLGSTDQRLFTHFNTKGNASIGQHVRHALEFYQCLFRGGENVNYDERKRDILLESSVKHAQITIDSVINQLDRFTNEYIINVHANMSTESNDILSVKSSLSRELLYVLEHTIHHMALMRVLIKDYSPTFELSDSFGVAYSTLAYRAEETKS